MLHGEVFDVIALHKVIWIFRTAAHGAIVHVGSLALVRPLQPLDLEDAQIDPIRVAVDDDQVAQSATDRFVEGAQRVESFVIQ